MLPPKAQHSLGMVQRNTNEVMEKLRLRLQQQENVDPCHLLKEPSSIQSHPDDLICSADWSLSNFLKCFVERFNLLIE